MKIRTKYLILFASILILTACDGKKNQEKARVLFEEGVRLREERHSEEAAEELIRETVTRAHTELDK